MSNEPDKTPKPEPLGNASKNRIEYLNAAKDVDEYIDHSFDKINEVIEWINLHDAKWQMIPDLDE